MFVRAAIHALWISLGVISALEFLNMRQTWLRRKNLYVLLADWLPYGMLWTWLVWIDGVGNVVLPLYTILSAALHDPIDWKRRASLLGLLVPAAVYGLYQTISVQIEGDVLIAIAACYILFRSSIRKSYWTYVAVTGVTGVFCVVTMNPWSLSTFVEAMIVSGVFVLYEHDAVARSRIKEERGRDPLTGLSNRRGAEEWMRMYEGIHGVAVLIDLDDFKFVNDFFGHDVGDVALRKVGCLLSEVSPPQGVSVRWGGDEFLILAEYETAEEAKRFVDGLFTQLCTLEVPLTDGRLPLRCSVGAAYGNIGDTLITAADMALLRVKQSGKSAVQWYQAEETEGREQLRVDQYAFQKAFHQLTQYCPAPCLATDVEFRILDVNEAYERVSGYTRRVLRGQKPSILAAGDWNRKWYPEIQETLQMGHEWTGILRNQRSDGTIWCGEMMISPVRIGELTAGYWCIVRRVFTGDMTHTELGTDIMLDQETAEYMENIFLQTLAEVAEWGDPELRGHVLRVSRYTEWLASRLAERNVIDPGDVPVLSVASITHDIGKVAIAREILFKPHTLDDAEYLYVQRHTEIGEQILQSVLDKLDDIHVRAKRVVECAKTIAGSHHEWWNGSGYPRSLKGDEIPLAGRIVAIADVLDALLSRRPYKEPWALDEVRHYLEAQSGTQFDPQFVSVLLEEWTTFEGLVREVSHMR
ncbi:diguanylate cyclase domain-containing protein [Alicyclobacillus fructus]|uniref:diguanylate cyclase domain-containing protein n=1 Tax=Alicyclobacillus fructus TaxID=2816082 RepID=UPI001F3FB1B2|nr:HD domain-containing phosphohydrolase [Alicyclobacillus fructus]